MHFLDLPTDVLFSIFQFLDVQSLGRLSQVCQLLKKLASSDQMWKGAAQRLIFTSSKYGLNSSHCPPLKLQCRLSKRWVKGQAKIKKLTQFETNYMPWLVLGEDNTRLFIAKGDSLQSVDLKLWMGISHPRKQDLKSSFSLPTVVHKNIDVCRFFLSPHYIVTGGWNGKLTWCSKLGSAINLHNSAHESHISDVALLENTIISGSRDGNVKIWKISDCKSELNLRSIVPIGDKVLSIALNEYNSSFAVGSGGLNEVHPLQVKDLTSGNHLFSLGSGYKHGAGVLDCHYQSPYTLMSAGYDTYVRLWDTRVSHCLCVGKWEEPHDNTVYCVASDCRYGFVSGSCRHGAARVWDSRMRKCIQTFYLGGKVSSPVYSLQLTHTHLFAGLARGIMALDFR